MAERTRSTRDLKVVAPLLASNRWHADRHVVVTIGTHLSTWVDRFHARNLELLQVTPEALILNTEGIAEEICKTIFAIHPDDLADMIKQGMTAKQIAFGLNMSVAGLYRLAQRLFRRPWSELCSGLS